MANILNFDNVAWEGQQANDVFIKPAFLIPSITSEVEVMLGVKSKRQVVLDTNLRDIVRASSGCGRTTAGDVIDLTDKFLEVCDAKINLEQCAKNLADTFMEEWLKTGNAIYDLTGTEVATYIERKVSEALARDVYTILWFGDTQSNNATLATCDGLWKKLINGVSAYGVQRAYTFQSNTLTAGQSLTVLREMHENASDLLDQVADNEKYFKLTRDLYYNYLALREDACCGDMSWQMLENGSRQVYFRGIPVYKATEWSNAISHYNLSFPNRAIYTAKSNLYLGTDAISDTNSFEMYYERKDKLTYIDGEFKIGTQYMYDELTVLAY
jgi:hypothetical protein